MTSEIKIYSQWETIKRINRQTRQSYKLFDQLLYSGLPVAPMPKSIYSADVSDIINSKRKNMPKLYIKVEHGIKACYRDESSSSDACSRSIAERLLGNPQGLSLAGSFCISHSRKTLKWKMGKSK